MTLVASTVLGTLEVRHVVVESAAEADPLARALKLGISACCALMVWLAGSDASSRRDGSLMALVFACFLTGDVAFAADRVASGVAAFLIGHLVLLVRNGTGLGRYLRARAYESHRTRLTGVIGVPVLLTSALVGVVLRPLGAGSPRFPEVVAYAIVLGAGLAMAWAVPLIDHFPRTEGRCIARGVSFLYLCDFTVGMEILAPQPAAPVLNLAIWIFYVPGLLFLVRSAYRRIPAPGGSTC